MSANVQLTWNGDIGKATLNALHDVPDGEAISITYLSGPKLGQITEPKHTAPINFNCNCDLHI